MAQLLLTGSFFTTGSNLELALQLVEARLDDWASNSDAYNAMLLEIFGAQSSDASRALQTSLSGSGLGIRLEILAGNTLSGINGAYTSAAPGGGERIYLNGAWLQIATAAEIEAVLLEELGHAIDHQLNGDADTPGDEGEIFSARLRGQTPASSAFSEDDHRLISLNGFAVAIEAADTTAPTGSLFTTAPAYAPVARSGLGFVGYFAKPTFADADGDGDLDLFIGKSDGNTLFFRNTANPGATALAYDAGATNPFGISDVGYLASPALADADGDGDLDLFIGNLEGNTLFFRNTGSSTAPAYAAAVTNPFGISDVGLFVTPAFADVDADGDLDLFIGKSDGNTLFFRNTTAPGATAPAYAALSTNPFGISDVGGYASPAFADADADGDLDLFIGEFYGNTLFFRNTATTPVAPVASSTANGSYGIGAAITLTMQFSEVVLVTTTGGTPTLQLETGAIDRVATYLSGSGTNTLSFRYIVQAGDTSADLDQLSANALTLNGSTIRDAAGNNAILTLAAPGATGSLAANAAVVIDGIAPITAAAVIAITDNVGIFQGTVASGATTDDSSLSISGTISVALATGETVRIYDGSTYLGNASVTGTTWSYADSRTLNNNQNVSYTARIADAAGNQSAAGTAYLATLDTTAPTVAITSIGGADTTFSSQTGDATVVGTAEANRLVTIKYGATALGTSTANGTGGFSYTLTAANLTTIGQGTGKSITASQSDATGNTGISNAFSFALDTLAPTTTIAITAVNDNVGLIQGNQAADAFTDDTTPTLSGSISAALATGDNLRIFNGNTLLGNATVNNTAKTWSFTPSTALANGFYAVTAKVNDLAGNLSAASPAQRFSIDATANQIIGDANANTLTTTTAKDVLTGLGGIDTFKFTALTSSTLANFDRITDFSIGTDILDGPTAVSAANINKFGAVTALSATSISTVLTATTFLANRAATFSYADPSGVSRSFIALNNATAGYQASADAIIEITGYIGSLDSLQLI